MSADNHFRVLRRQDNGRTSVLFDDPNEEAAVAYVQDNFPRPHIEPGSVPDRLRADVQLVSPDGTVKEFHGVGAGWVEIEDDEVVVHNSEENVPSFGEV